MPIYIYGCKHCGSEFTFSHSMTEVIEDCEVCDVSGSLTRRPSIFSNIKKSTKQKQKAGSHVEEFIQDAKKELQQQKENLRSRND